jgi:hypothetical protein
MKITLLFLSFILLLSQDIAAITTPIKKPQEYQFLIAEKGGRKKIFHRGTSVRIDYGSSNNLKRIKGVITKITGDSVVVSNYKKRNIITQSIAIKDIEKLTKIKRKLKKGLLTIGIITLVLGGGLLYLFNNAPDSAAYVEVVLYLFGVSALYMILIGLFLVYMPEIFGGQSIKKGWKFRAV